MALIVGNWKMYKTIQEAVDFVHRVAPQIGEGGEVGLAVPFTAIHPASQAASGTQLQIGAQNMHSAEEGAFTGEVAGRMLVEAGASFVLLGHSERRHIFGESDQMIHNKLKRALEVGLRPIVCVGETLEQHKAGDAKEVVQGQLRRAIEGIDDLSNLAVAYEPVWAIGTGETATPEWAVEMHQALHEVVHLPVLYGGSVKPSNAADLLSRDEIDGVLVGGASLDPDSFLEIARSA